MLCNHCVNGSQDTLFPYFVSISADNKPTGRCGHAVLRSKRTFPGRDDIPQGTSWPWREVGCKYRFYPLSLAPVKILSVPNPKFGAFRRSPYSQRHDCKVNGDRTSPLGKYTWDSWDLGSTEALAASCTIQAASILKGPVWPSHAVVANRKRMQI